MHEPSYKLLFTLLFFLSNCLLKIFWCLYISSVFGLTRGGWMVQGAKTSPSEGPPDSQEAEDWSLGLLLSTQVGSTRPTCHTYFACIVFQKINNYCQQLKLGSFSYINFQLSLKNQKIQLLWTLISQLKNSVWVKWPLAPSDESGLQLSLLSTPHLFPSCLTPGGIEFSALPYSYRCFH